MKPKIAIVRGKFLNRYEMQFFEPLVRDFDITAFGSLTPYHDHFAFPVVKLPSPMDVPDFPYKMPILNRIFIDAHYLLGLEERLKGFDIIHSAETYFHYTQQALNAKKRGYVNNVIATVLENIPFNNESIWGRKTYKKKARKELDHIIALTNKTKGALIMEGCDTSKITVISHFVDTKRFQPINDRSMRYFYRNPATILFVGRLEEYKGVFDVVGAARNLLSDRDLNNITLRFLFVGEGSQRQKLLELEKSLGIEKFITHKTASYEEMPVVFQGADIFVAPSTSTSTWAEQYNTSLLEAQASGLPIVTTRTGGIPENVGNAAVLVEPGDAVALTDALKHYILDPRLRRSYSLKARERAVNVHDISIGARKMKDLYLKLLEP